MFPDELQDMAVCNATEGRLSMMDEFDSRTPNETRRCFGVSGLVYLCRASSSDCEPFLGNGDKSSADGYLYKRNRMFSHK